MNTSPAAPTGITSISWKAAVLAGIAAGVVFLMLEMGLVTMTGGSPWGPPRMMAAIVMGEAVLPPPATFDLLILMVSMAVHMVLSVALAVALAFGLEIARRWTGLALLIGDAFGLAVYVANFYAFTEIYPWFATARNLVTIVSHVVFGVVAAWTYLRLSRS